MKTPLILLFSFICINLFAQDWNDDDRKEKHHKVDRYKKDYFTVGLYTGSYIGKGSLIEANKYLNLISVEFEYFKFSDLSIYLRGLNRFSKYSASSSVDYPNYKLVIGFGGRYYARKNGIVKPYLQAGLNQETEHIEYSLYGGRYEYRYFINFGVGVSVKLSQKFTFDMKYDLNKSIDKKVYYTFNGFSVLAGLKYNL